MLKIFFRIFTIIFILIILFIVFLSTAGIETDKFNNIIKNNINKVNSNIDVEIKDVKIILNPIKFTLDIKTVGPIISYYSNIYFPNDDEQISHPFFQGSKILW